MGDLVVCSGNVFSSVETVRMLLFFTLGEVIYEEGQNFHGSQYLLEYSR